jgi:hypothetical protein
VILIESLAYGAVAQLGERYTGSVEVVSSSLIGSILTLSIMFSAGFFIFPGDNRGTKSGTNNTL